MVHHYHDHDDTQYPWPPWGSQWMIPSDRWDKPLNWDDSYFPDPYQQP